MDIPQPSIFSRSDHHHHHSSNQELVSSDFRTPRHESVSGLTTSFSDLFTNVASHENTFREIFGFDAVSNHQGNNNTNTNSGLSLTNGSNYNSNSNLSANFATKTTPQFHTVQPDILTSLPIDILNTVVSKITNQNDLVNLSTTCSTFNTLVNVLLYKKIQIVDSDVVVDETKAKNYITNEYTYLKVHNLKLFIRSIINNFKILDHYVHEICIITNSDKSAYEYNSNPYEILYDLISKSDNKSLTLLNFDFANIKMFNNYLNFVKNKFFQNNTANLYEQFNSTPSGSFDTSKVVANKFAKNLKFYQLLDLNDINSLPLSIDKLSFFSIYGANYNPFQDFQPNYSGIRALYNLNSLYLNSSLITNEFFNKMAAIFQTDSLEKVRLHTLSITYTHNHAGNGIINQETKLNFNDIASIFDLNYLRNFEVKAKCSTSQQCNHCLIDFFQDWNSFDEVMEHVDVGSDSDFGGPSNNYIADSPAAAGNLKVNSHQLYSVNPIAASSYCYFPSNSLVNIPATGHRDHSNLYYQQHHLQNPQHHHHYQQQQQQQQANHQLRAPSAQFSTSQPDNNFFNIEKLSIIKVENAVPETAPPSTQTQYEKFVSDYLIHFQKLKHLFLNLYDFSPPSYLSLFNNWNNRENRYALIDIKKRKIVMFKEILKLKSLTTLIIPDFFHSWSLFLDNNYEISEINYITFLNSCTCQECSEARAIFKAYSAVYHSTGSTANMESPDYKQDMEDKECFLENEPLAYYNFYYFILKQLRNRLPFSDYALNLTSGLDLLKYPINDFNNKFIYDFVPVNSNSGKSFEEFETEFKRNFSFLVSLLIHSVRKELKIICKNLEKLHTLVLGGVYFHVERKELGKVTLTAIYDDYEETF